jgi:hypothetical protein
MGKDFWISWATGVDESSPAITGMESTQEYFVAWQHPQGVVDKPILGRSVSFQGDLGIIAEFSGPAAENPGLATGPGGDLLVAWQDQPVSATNANLYGSLWGNRLYLPALLMSRK